MQKELLVRKNIRLKDYDYSQGGYHFVTICTKDRQNLLGGIVGAASGRPEMVLSNHGEIVKSWIDKISEKYPYVKIENAVVMPNHIHIILSINTDGRPDAAPTATLGSIIGYFKHQTTKDADVHGLWQRSYHDHIIRDEAAYQRIYQYIAQNPALWLDDCYYTT